MWAWRSALTHGDDPPLLAVAPPVAPRRGCRAQARGHQRRTPCVGRSVLKLRVDTRSRSPDIPRRCREPEHHFGPITRVPLRSAADERDNVPKQGRGHVRARNEGCFPSRARPIVASGRQPTGLSALANPTRTRIFPLLPPPSTRRPARGAAQHNVHADRQRRTTAVGRGGSRQIGTSARPSPGGWALVRFASPARPFVVLAQASMTRRRVWWPRR
jgi:hypothetical protein